MPPRTRGNDYQYAGFGGLSYGTNYNFANLPMSYEQRLWALESLYSFAVAKIEEDKTFKEDEDVGKLIGAIRILLNKAGVDYKTEFESHKSFCKDENKYRELLTQIFEKITQLQGKTKMIERVREEQVEAG